MLNGKALGIICFAASFVGLITGFVKDKVDKEEDNAEMNDAVNKKVNEALTARFGNEEIPEENPETQILDEGQDATWES